MQRHALTFSLDDFAAFLGGKLSVEAAKLRSDELAAKHEVRRALVNGVALADIPSRYAAEHVFAVATELGIKPPSAEAAPKPTPAPKPVEAPSSGPSFGGR